MPAVATESHFELAAIDRLKSLGYRYLYGDEIDRPLTAVILAAPLREHLQRRYRHLPPAAIEQAIRVVSAPEGATLDRRNMAFQRLLREGYTLRYEEDGEEKFKHIYFLDFDEPERNHFLAVNQITIQGTGEHLPVGMPGNTRRPDLIVARQRPAARRL
jgi:type I restriction enzyme R subunit